MSTKVYEIITQQILERIEKGEIPWRRPWIGGGLPKNLISKKEYAGINPFLLNLAGYASPHWLSYKQAQSLGGSVKKGEKGAIIIFWKQVKVKDDKSKDDGEKAISMLRYYRVFNVEQCELPDNKIPVTDINPNFQPIAACEKTVADMPNKPDIQHKEQRAYYSAKEDYINMPKKETFVNPEFYYSALFHELGHSTRHETRLARKLEGWTPFGSNEYSKEELVAEMTAAFLCGKHGIEQETIENSAAYIKSWIRRFKDKPKMVVEAASKAQKAVNYIMNEGSYK